ncbi:phage holin family protein [Compostimonas suwonensis]|uniref:Putative superfamily III holin-X n=1 Tax=Compostimonas suwonensis TaxID=1048394 RepID=A0A2M9C448_9MICO|nr:phage holin family protein [Compostimonas suwonensis]PJJ65237.1 putative superfamily III holin-X [Compostimonas suwonensis]
MSYDEGFTPKNKKSIFTLIGEIPALLVTLVKAELEQLKAEMTRKLAHAGIGIGMLLVAALLAFFALATLVAAAVLGIAVALPPWLAALIVAAALLVLAGILVALGVRWLKKGVPIPNESIDSIKADVHALKGVGKYDH